MTQSTSNHPCSILLLGTQMTVGGAQRLLLDQAQWFHAHGHRVSVAFFYDKDGLQLTWQSQAKFPIENLRAFSPERGTFSQIPQLLAGLARLWSLMRREKFHVVITFTQDSNMLGIPLAWLSGIPVRIGTYLGAIRGMAGWRKKLHAWIVNTGLMDRIVTASTRTQRNAVEEGVLPERVAVVFNGIAPFSLDASRRTTIRAQLGLGDADVYVLAVGRLVYEKGHEFLVRAMENVRITNPNVKAGICGTGPLYNALQAQISDAGLDGIVRLLGQWPDVHELLAASDIFVLPSRWEGLPMALLEAMMAAKPVIATRVEGVEDVVEHNVHGLLVPLEDHWALADAIGTLSMDLAVRHRMGIQGSLRVLDAYTTDHMCRNYLRVVNELLVSKLGVSGLKDE